MFDQRVHKLIRTYQGVFGESPPPAFGDKIVHPNCCPGARVLTVVWG